MVHALVVAAVLGHGPAWTEGEAAVEDWLRGNRAVGVSVAVVEDGAEWTAQAGFADREAEKPVQATTLFRLASISKAVCATLTMGFVQRRMLDLDARVSRSVPGFADERGAITLRRVLSHTAGIRSYRAGRPDVFHRPLSTEEALGLIRHSALRFEPGTAYGYSTHAFVLPVAAMERVAKLPYREILRLGVSRWGMDSLDVEISTEYRAVLCGLSSVLIST
ncbi:MAG: serine hydrolase domain-containing protein, partial [Fimbriimonadales bacterium]